MPDIGTTLRERLKVSVAVLAFGLLKFIRFSSWSVGDAETACRKWQTDQGDHTCGRTTTIHHTSSDQSLATVCHHTTQYQLRSRTKFAK
jgi:hypothetical protein